MTKRADFTMAQLARAIRVADATGKVAVQTPMGIAYLDPASLPEIPALPKAEPVAHPEPKGWHRA